MSQNLNNREPTDVDPGIDDPNLDSEALLVAAMLWSSDTTTLQKITEYFVPADFFRPQYAAIFEAIKQSMEDKAPTDHASIRSFLRKQGDNDLIKVSQVDNLIVTLMGLHAHDLQVLHYAKQAASESYRRQFRDMAVALVDAADTAPEHQLFEKIMVEEGKKQRTQWQRYQEFVAVRPDSSTP